VVRSAGGARAAQRSRLALVSSRRHVDPCYGGYDLPGVYEPVDDPLERVTAATDRTTPMKLGETIEV